MPPDVQRVSIGIMQPVTDPRLLVLGLGYSGSAVARAAVAAGWSVRATAREPARVVAPSGVDLIRFDAAGPAIRAATHLLITAPPDEAGDPVLAAHGAAVAAAAALRWIGYVSTTGVYGDRGGAWVTEADAPTPAQPRSIRRLAAERAWAAAAAGRPLDLFRAGGIYGPGRAPFGELRAGTARRTLAPGHVFSRVHRDDIARAVLAAIARPPPESPNGTRVLHLVDDEPAESAAVAAFAAQLLGVPPPPAVPLAEAWPAMSPMARSFWSERRRVGNAVTRAALDLAWRYPSYREGLAAILAEERGHGSGQ